MRTITLKVTINIPDDYQVDEPKWVLENAINRAHQNIYIESVEINK